MYLDALKLAALSHTNQRKVATVFHRLTIMVNATEIWSFICHDAGMYICAAFRLLWIASNIKLLRMIILCTQVSPRTP